MKYIITILLLSCSLCLNAYAQSDNIQALEEVELQMLMNKYQWLYEILMPEEYQTKAWQERSQKSFRVHLRDSVREFPHPDSLAERSFATKAQNFLITGRITYVGFFPKRYRYNVEVQKDGSVVFKVRVRFKTGSAKEKARMRKRIKLAQEDWNENRYDFGIDYRFDFDSTERKSEAHFNVRLKENTRGPYDTNWNVNWSARTVAHEMGHMLGLGDEYKTLSGKIDCIRTALMCAGTTHMPFHHYHVLRRLFLKEAIKD